MTPAERKRAAFLSGPPWPPLIRMAIPTTVAMLISSMMSVVETWFLGRIGTIELAAVALVFPIYMLTMMLAAGSVGGAAAGATANALGAGDQARAEMILRASLRIAIIAGLLMGALFFFVGPAFYTLLGGEGAVLASALAYSEILMSGLVLVWVFNMISGILRGAGDMVTPACLQALVSVSHLVLCWLLIGELQLGIEGAAYAMIGSFGIGTVALFAVFATGRSPVAYRPGAVARTVVVPLLKIGTLAGFQAVITIATALLITGLIGQLGAEWLAGYGVATRLEFLMIPIIFGFGAALIAMSGANKGAGQLDRATGIAWRGTAATTCIVGCIGLLNFAFPEAWASFFTDDAQVIEASAAYMRHVAPFYAFFALGLTLYFASQGMLTLGVPVFGSLLRFAIIGGGGYLLSEAGLASPENLFTAVAVGMFAYGVVIALGLRLIVWKPSRLAAQMSAG